jgi:hypothetical protein
MSNCKGKYQKRKIIKGRMAKGEKRSIKAKIFSNNSSFNSQTSDSKVLSLK